MNRRQKTWDLLKELRSLNQSPWMVIGDFNEVLYHHEKWGEPDTRETNAKIQRSIRNMLLKRSRVKDIGLHGVIDIRFTLLQKEDLIGQ